MSWNNSFMFPKTLTYKWGWEIKIHRPLFYDNRGEIFFTEIYFAL